MTVEIVIRRNQNGSVLAYEAPDHAKETFADHREVLSSLYDLVDRRNGENGETVARVRIDADRGTVGVLEIPDRFRRDLNPDRAIELVEDVRHHAISDNRLIADGGSVDNEIVELPPGHPGPDYAERVDGGDCTYCGDGAEFEVWMGGVSFLTCSSCSRENAIHAQDLLEESEEVDDA